MNTRTQALGGGAAPAAAAVRKSIAGVFHAVWNFLANIGARRARAELLRLARMHELSSPELAAQMRRVAREGWL